MAQHGHTYSFNTQIFNKQCRDHVYFGSDEKLGYDGAVLIGVGAFAHVYKARSRRQGGAWVAIKQRFMG